MSEVLTTYTKTVKIEKNILTMSVTCVDERLAPRLHLLSFRVPGASIVPRKNEPSYSLAAILFFAATIDFYSKSRIVIADHGQISEKGFVNCGMSGIKEHLGQIKRNLLEQQKLTIEEIDAYLSRISLYDINNLGGIGKHAQWEVERFNKIPVSFAPEGLLGKILPNDYDKELIPNERLIITQPYINQSGLLTNTDEEGKSFDGSTIIQTVAGLPVVQDDYNLTNGLLLFNHIKGEAVREVLVLEPAMNALDQTPVRRLLQKTQQTLDLTIRQLTQEIARVTNIPFEECYRYFLSIKDNTNICLYGLEVEQLKRAKKLAKAIESSNLLSDNITVKYGLTDIQGTIKKLFVL
ncbi:MAG: hypothetical protein JXA54_04375 [Candidatus Heimdallarchaeota archaeon]|nr:hypothetical protein [Candidatus Heimdallarchaeota archaeon]